MKCIPLLFTPVSSSLEDLNITLYVYKLSYGFLHKLSRPCICFRKFISLFAVRTGFSPRCVWLDCRGIGRSAPWEGRDVEMPAWAHNYHVCTLNARLLFNSLHLIVSVVTLLYQKVVNVSFKRMHKDCGIHSKWL